MYDVIITSDPVKLGGIAATNWYRARGLHPYPTVDFGRCELLRREVPATFARIWFPPDVQFLVIKVDLEHFSKEEFKQKHRGGFIPEWDYVHGDPTFELRLTTEQVQWLVIKDFIRRNHDHPSPTQEA